MGNMLMACMTGRRPASSANLSVPGKHRCVCLLVGIGVTLEVTSLFWIMVVKWMLLKVEPVSNNSKLLTEQLFHKGMFINRPILNWFGERTNATQLAGNPVVEIPEKSKQPTREQEWKQVNYDNRHKQYYRITKK